MEIKQSIKSQLICSNVTLGMISKTWQQIILTNFHKYIETFNETFDDTYHTKGSAFEASSSKKAHVTIIEFGVGSAMAH